jgi:NADPH:quinone reductase-like Zn-dependent oxidoreductase
MCINERQMKAVQILEFGSLDVMNNVDIPRPEPGNGEVLVSVRAAGVGPWDALIRAGNSEIPQSLPLILGSDLAGTVEALGPGVSGFQIGDEVYGVTNERFTGAYAEYAVASAGMIARKPKSLSFIEAASVPVVAVTAWQMLFEYAQVLAGQTVLIHGGAGNVGGYAVQLARDAGLNAIATAGSSDVDYVRSLGAQLVIDYHVERFDEVVSGIDVVLDTVGGDTRERSFRVLKQGGMLVSVVSKPSPKEMALRHDVKAVFFYVEVSTNRLNTISELFDRGKLVADVGTVLPLEGARAAHQMLAGAPHARGKIVLSAAAGGV